MVGEMRTGNLKSFVKMVEGGVAGLRGSLPMSKVFDEFDCVRLVADQSRK